jgi:glutamyl/glutaminyl-tRNA synthetase
MRDPAIYRIRRATHHNTGDKWCIYPMYTFAHPIEDALEQITHSICTLEFEDQRPFYDWLMARLIEGDLLAAPAPKQYEFARLNLTYVITSKRKLAQLVYDHRVNGWDDPRMPTIVGLRRRAARKNRHGQPQHQYARPGHLPHPPRYPPPHRRQMVHLPDVHLCPPHRRRAGANHPQHLHPGV